MIARLLQALRRRKARKLAKEEPLVKAQVIGCPHPGCRSHELPEYLPAMPCGQYGQADLVAVSAALRCRQCGYVAWPDEGHQATDVMRAAYWWAVHAARRNLKVTGEGILGMSGEGQVQVKPFQARGR
jgi:hypothetical protein